MWTIVDREWRYGDTMCKLFKFFQTFGLTSSTYLVVAIALDRLWAIVTPLSRSEEQHVMTRVLQRETFYILKRVSVTGV